MQLDTHIQNNDPQILLPHYRELFSGNKEEDKTTYTMAYPSSIYPTLHLGFPIYDDMGNKLEPGHYEVAISEDKKYLLLIQSKKLIAKVPVIKYDFDQKKYDENWEKYNELKDKLEYYQVRNNLKRIKEYRTEMEYQNKKLLANNKVELDHSNPNYFVIDYNCNFARALGYIKRASQD